MRSGITLACTVCKNENYRKWKNKKNNPDKMEIKKFCPHCNATTLHKEKK